MKTEEAMLQMKQRSAEEVAQRHGELPKMRELIFRAEVKARRVGGSRESVAMRVKMVQMVLWTFLWVGF